MKPTAVANVLGSKIKELRKQKGLTLEKLGEKIGSSKSYVWEIENKGVKRPSAEKLAAIAKELDVTTDYLVDDAQTEVTDDLKKEVFYLKLGQLQKADRDKIMDIIDAWSKK